MNNKKTSYLLLPLFIITTMASYADEPAPIIIADSDADVEIQSVQNSEVALETKAPNENEAIFEGGKKEDVVTLESKDTKTKKNKKNKKKKDDYSEYLIPVNGYMPVGEKDDRQVQIQGAVSKTAELTLADCLELAMTNNPKIQAAYALANATKEHKVQAISNYTPNISTTSGITRIKPNMIATGGEAKKYTQYLLGEVTISEMVYDFGFTQNQYTIGKVEWELSKQNIESTVNSVVRDVKDAYYNLLYALSAKQVRQDTVEHFEQMYKQANAFYQIGTHPKVDVTIASANLADAKANYIAATNAVDIAVSRLNNVMGTPFIEPYVVDISMPYQETDVTMKQAVEIANEARPDLKMAISELQLAEQNLKLAKKAYAPNITFQADMGVGGKHNFTDKNWYNVGGYFNFPILNPVSITSKIKEAKASLIEQQYQTKSAVNDIYYEIQSAYVSLNDARERISASKIAVQEARESYELSQGRYKAGVCDAIELKEAEITYENARLAYIHNIYLYNSAKANLEKAIGKTLQNSNIQENVEI